MAKKSDAMKRKAKARKNLARVRKELARFKRRVAADLGVVLTRTQKMLLQHLGILQKIVEDPKASPEARLSAIKSAGRTLDRLRVAQRRRYIRD